MLPLQMAAAREAVANPKDKAKQAQLDDMSERLRDALEALLTALADNDDEAAATAANQQAREVERLSNAAREGDARAVEMAAKSLAKKQPKLAKQARCPSPPVALFYHNVC
jgi:rubrerythrin